jgi:tRNA threonylcarbamoyladenosine biosynthesis protein TsaB
MSDRAAKNLLAIDTAAGALSVALCAGSDSWYFEANAGTRHSQLLMEIIDFLMGKAGLEPDDLSAICCMAGPGSFTGLRIGFACAKGLALSLGIPFFPVSSLDCMASRFSQWPGIVIPAIDAKKNSFFSAIYSGGKRLCPDMDADAGTIACAIKKASSPNASALLTGPDAEKLHIALSSTLAGTLKAEGEFAPDLSFDRGCLSGYAKELLAIAKNMETDYNKPIDFSLGPEYIRKSDAEMEND